jgi:hypothetical protein
MIKRLHWLLLPPESLACKASDRQSGGRASGVPLQFKTVPVYGSGDPRVPDLTCDRRRTRRYIVFMAEIPLYGKVQEVLASEIGRGDLKPGDRLRTC